MGHVMGHEIYFLRGLLSGYPDINVAHIGGMSAESFFIDTFRRQPGLAAI
jgi:hypothetical protein